MGGRSSSGHRHRRSTIAVTSLYLIPFIYLLLLLLLPAPTAAFTGRTPLRRRFLQRSSTVTVMEAGRSSSNSGDGDGQQPPLPPGAVVLTVGEIEGRLVPPPAPAAENGGEREEDPVAAAKRLRRARARQRRRQRKRQEAAAEAAATGAGGKEEEEEDVIVLAAAAAAAAAVASSASLQEEEQKKKKKKKGKGGLAAAAAATGATPPEPQKAPRPPLKPLSHIQRKPTTWVYQREGEHPNVLWRAISWAELRRHPCFDPLPHPSAMRPSPSSPFNRRNGSSSSIPVKTAADLRLFRQESWEWDALHVGRLTTSRVGGMLGFYEPQTAGILRVPRSLTSTARASGARAHLSQPPPPCYIAFLRSLQEHSSSSSSSSSHDEDEDARKIGTWLPHGPKQPPAAARHFLYQYKPPAHHPRSANKRMQLSTGGVRMRWGSTQEATSVLAALNFLGMQGARVREAGLYPLEAIYPTPQALAAAYPSLLRPHPGVPPEAVRDLPPMGASPDGVVVWGDGTVEALEAKNHSPFRAKTTHRHNGGTARGSSKRNGGNNGARFIISDQGPHTAIGPWHVAQLCWHMLCLGPTCRSALFVSASATKGVVLLRLRRDEAYINHMLRWLHLFVNRYLGAGGGEGSRKLDVDFFLQGPAALNSREERKEYRAFLEATLQLAASAEMVARIPHEAVQRSPLQGDFFLDNDV